MLVEVLLSSEEDANKVLELLQKLIREYRHTTVADYLELVGLSSTFMDQKVGWTNLDDVQIKPAGKGFMLELSEPKTIDFSSSSFPFLKDWWIVADVENDQKYEGWLVDAIGDTMILKSEPSQIRFGVSIYTVKKFDAYRERPSTPV